MPTPSLNIYADFAGTETSPDTQSMQARDGTFNLSIGGTWTGTVTLERSWLEEDDWQIVEVFTGTSVPADDIVQKFGTTSGQNWKYRFTSVVSGGTAKAKANQ